MEDTEIPYKHIEKPKVLSREGNSADVFEFKPKKGKTYVYKNIRQISFAMENYPGTTLVEKAKGMKDVYEILREYFGGRIAKTHFVIGKDEKGKPCVQIAQEKIPGTILKDMLRTDERAQSARRQHQEIKNILSKVMEDKRLDKYPLAKDWLDDIGYPGNIIIDEQGKATIIDW